MVKIIVVLDQHLCRHREIFELHLDGERILWRRPDKEVTPGVVAGGKYGCTGLHLPLHVAGVVFVLIDAHVGILGINGIIPVVVDTLGEATRIFVENELRGFRIPEGGFICSHSIQLILKRVIP